MVQCYFSFNFLVIVLLTVSLYRPTVFVVVNYINTGMVELE